jgi:hypothetical protein
MDQRVENLPDAKRQQATALVLLRIVALDRIVVTPPDLRRNVLEIVADREQGVALGKRLLELTSMSAK